MIEKTLILVGPGGIGKSPLSHCLRSDLASVDPYRLRGGGPRDRKDTLYAAPKLRDELHVVLRALGTAPRRLAPTVEWFPEAKLLFFQVRDDWQLLMLAGLDAALAKAEVYAPVIPLLLREREIAGLFGQIEGLVLHPGTGSLRTMKTWDELEAKTAENCTLRGDDASSIKKRTESISEEAPAWKAMLDEGATEYEAWPFPEHVFKREGLSPSALCAHQIDLLLNAKSALLAKNPRLGAFFRRDDEIREITSPLVA